MPGMRLPRSVFRFNLWLLLFFFACSPIFSITLNSVSVTPATVQSGQVVTLTIDAIGDSPGLDPSKCSAVLFSPQGLDQVTINSFVNVSGNVYQGTATIPVYAAAGEWHVSSIMLVNLIGGSVVNTVFVSKTNHPGFPTTYSHVTFTVSSSQQDKVQPTLNSVSLSPSGTLTGGETLTLTVNATDNLSGVKASFISALVFNSAGMQNIYFSNFVQTSADTYQGTAALSSYAKSGTWRIQNVIVYDNAGNYRYCSADLADVSDPNSGCLNKTFVVNNPGQDGSPPVFKSATISPSGTLSGGSTVTLTISATDDLSGLDASKIGVSVIDPNGVIRSDISFLNFQLLSSTMVQATAVLSPFAPSGTWRIYAIYLYDLSGNLKDYHDSFVYDVSKPPRDDFDLTFTVSNSNSDGTPPSLIRAFVTPTIISTAALAVGTSITLTIQATDDNSGIDLSNSGAVLMDPGLTIQSSPIFKFKLVSGNTYEAKGTLSENATFGVWRIHAIELRDKAGNNSYCSSDLRDVANPNSRCLDLPFSVGYIPTSAVNIDPRSAATHSLTIPTNLGRKMREMKIDVPAGFVSQTDILRQVVDGQPPAASGGMNLFGPAVDVTLDSGKTVFQQPVTLRFTVDLTILNAQLNGRSTSLVKIAYYSGDRWVPVADSILSGDTVVAEVNHFTKFAVIILAPQPTLSNVLVYPNPFNYSLPEHTAAGITFDRLSSNATIKIYDVSGARVKTLSPGTFSNAGDTGVANWNAKTEDAESLGTGLYIYVITDPAGGKKTGKIGVINE